MEGVGGAEGRVGGFYEGEDEEEDDGGDEYVVGLFGARLAGGGASLSHPAT
jgi:hypothetical protein